MKITLRQFAVAALLLVVGLPAVLAQDYASRSYDPPGRVAYLNHIDGGVGYSPAGEDDWLDVVRNRPLIRGDRLWTDRDARLELQVGSALVRLGPETALELLALDDEFAQLELTEGVIQMSVRRLQRGEVYEIATPNLALVLERAGRYRIDVDARRNETTVVVWQGAAVAYGEDSTFRLSEGEAVRFYGSDLRDYRVYGLPRADAFDRYCEVRDRRIERSQSLRYLDDSIAGYASLDEYGSWRTVRSYGNVWFPSSVDRDWAPYRDGHWVWQEPWGWTWVDNAPWGFAPSHYGRWAYVSNRWGWIPGPRQVRAVYAPALVVFVGGSGWNLSVSSGGGSPIGWFALGPREVYVPSYRASRDYFSRVNVHNTVINTTIINNTYNVYSRGGVGVGQNEYANRRVSGAVTAVPGNVFTSARQVRAEAIRLQGNSLRGAENLRIAAVAPSRRSVIGANATSTRIKPTDQVFDRAVVARTAPPPTARSFNERAQQLQRTPGRVAAPESTAAPARSRETAPANIRVLAPARTVPDARIAGSGRRNAANPAAAAQPLDRSAESRPVPAPATAAPPADRATRSDTLRQPPRGQQPAPTAPQDAARNQRQQEQQQREDSARQQQREQQATERQRQQTMQVDKEQEQRQREAANRERAQRDEQSAVRQRAADAQVQAEQGQREDVARQQQREQQATERQRQVDMRAATAERERAAAAAESERQRATPRSTEDRPQAQRVERSARSADPVRSDNESRSERGRGKAEKDDPEEEQEGESNRRR